ncbi:TylF/MycF/NovP-related O-methyltransferase [Methylomonas sp. AM2-LC]|uniref:TylF/MycF/NovP-related O-methyltransferase n=1 Tax=Methylomonas sp. AM2-LC TaxID=3153301 RepID=UPI003266B5A5
MLLNFLKRLIHFIKRQPFIRCLGRLPYLSKGYCDNEIYIDPLWNHTLANSPEQIQYFQSILNSNLVAMSFHEVVNLHRIVSRTNHLSGDLAECGSFHGGSALIMAKANESKKPIHLFDTFTGIPEITADVDLLKVGDVKGSALDDVRNLLYEFNDLIRYHVGFFPETTLEIPLETKFSFVNLDMDVYESTKAGFEYFYPRMTRGGAIICHDYFSKSCPGVKKAVDEFFADKPETLIDLWHTQIVMIKL